jgi:hypothetical protein
VADLQALTLPPPYDGLDTDSAPEALADTKAPVVTNFLVDRPGQLPMRGPINEATASLNVVNGRMPVGPWIFNDKLLVGYREVDATKVRDPWTTPYRTATAAQLSSGALAIQHVDLITAAITEITPANVNSIPGPRSTRLGPYVYGPAFDSSTAAVNENGTFKKLTSLLRWNGTATAPTIYANAPRGAQDIKAHYQRLLVLGGRNPDGTGEIQQNTLWYSDVLSGTTALPDTVAAWQDDVSGLTNQIIVDSDDSSDFLVGAAKVGGNTVLFKRRSMHMLLGYSPSTWTIKTFTTEQGCIDARSIVEYQDGCFFMSDQGLMWFDGSQLVNTSRNLRSTLLASAVAAVGDPGVDGGRVIASRLPNDYIGISIGSSPSASSASVSSTTFCGLYHTRGAWTNLSSAALDGGYPIVLGRSSTRTFMFDDDKVIQANKLTAPEVATSDHGIDVVTNLFRWDDTTAFSGTGNTLLSLGVEAFPANTSTQYPIPAAFKSKLMRLAGPLQRSQLHRFLLDYAFTIVGSTGDGWYVALVAGDGTSLATEYQVPASSSLATSTYRRRHVKDVFSETNDLQVQVRWSGTGVPLSVATVFPFTVEFQPTRLRPGE